MRVNAIFLGIAVVLVVAPGQRAISMQSLDDEAMSAVAARDGITLSISAPQLSADTLDWATDAANATLASQLTMQNVSFTGVSETGVPGGMATATFNLDVGSDGVDPGVALSLDLSRTRLMIGDLKVNPADTGPRTFGTAVIDAEGSIRFFNTNGLLNQDDSRAFLSGSVDGGKIFYRQLWHEHPYLIFDNVQALWQFENATFGVIDQASDPFGIGAGLLQSADQIDLRLEADWQYKFPVGLGEQPFTITGNELPLLRFGWSGSVKDADLVWRAGGAWSGDNWNTPSEGLSFSSRWNYITNDDATLMGEPEREFRWVFGESGGGVQLELSDWKPLGNNAYAHNFPLISIDTLNAGQGPGPLCFGAPNAGPLGAGSPCTGVGRESLSLTAGNIGAFDRDTYGGGGAPRQNVKTDGSALAAFIRDGNLLAVSNQVKLVEAGVITREFDWGLIYTLANVDGNIYVYPGGNPSDDTLFGGGGDSLNRGIIADILLMSQSFDPLDPTSQGLNFNQGTHFMLADTDFEAGGVGIGFLGSSMLIAANDMRFWIKPQWDPTNFYEGGIDLVSPQARLNFRGTFGGATLPDGAEVIQGAFMDVNFEGLLNVRLSPSDPSDTVLSGSGSNYLGYSVAARFADLSAAPYTLPAGAGSIASGSGSYISIAEPNRKDVDFRLGNITGDIALVEGVMDLRGNNEEAPGSRPVLVVSHKILIGQTAAARMNDATVGLGLPGAAAGQPLVVNDISFSGDSLGRMAVPTGEWGATLRMKPLLPP